MERGALWGCAQSRAAVCYPSSATAVAAALLARKHRPEKKTEGSSSHGGKNKQTWFFLNYIKETNQHIIFCDSRYIFWFLNGNEIRFIFGNRKNAIRSLELSELMWSDWTLVTCLRMQTNNVGVCLFSATRRPSRSLLFACGIGLVADVAVDAADAADAGAGAVTNTGGEAVARSSSGHRCGRASPPGHHPTARKMRTTGRHTNTTTSPFFKNMMQGVTHTKKAQHL